MIWISFAAQTFFEGLNFSMQSMPTGTLVNEAVINGDDEDAFASPGNMLSYSQQALG
jgi:hypothetical protein